MDDLQALREKFTPKDVTSLKPTRQMSSARFTPDGKLLVACGYDGLLHRWEATAEWKELPTVAGHNGWVQDAVFSPDGATTYSADSWGGLRAVPTADEQPQPKWSLPAAHDGWVRALAISPNGELLATGGHDHKVRVWSSGDGAKKHEFEHPEPVFAVAFSPDSQSLVSGDFKGLVHHWDLTTGDVNPKRTLDASVLFTLSRLQDVGGVRCFAFSVDATLLAVGGTKPINGGTVQGIPTILVFDWAAGTLTHTLELGQQSDVMVTDVRFHPDGFLMATTTGNPGSGKFLFRRPGDAEPFFETKKMPNCHSLSLHPDGKRLAVVATNGGSNGNGRNLKDGKYPGNWSPIFVLELP
jgi:WD40 repeat protein